MLDRPFSLRKYVVEMFDDEGFDDQTAVESLVRRAQQDPDLNRSLLLTGAKQAVRNYYKDGRTESYPISGARAAVSRSAKAEQAKMTKAERERREAEKENRRQLIDTYSLWGHLALRDALKGDIRASITHRNTQLRGQQKAIRFEQAVLDAMTSETKTCADQLGAARVDRLWMRHYGR